MRQQTIKRRANARANKNEMFLTSLQSKSELFFVSIAIIGFSLIVWGKLSCLDGLERENSLRLYDLFLKSVVERL